MDGTLAIIGTGRMGEALLRGVLRSGQLGVGEVVCTVRRQERGDELAARHGVRVSLDNRAAIAAARVVVLAVKPQGLLGLLEDLAEAFHPGQTVISIAAGIRTDALEERLPGDVPVVRVMTNTPVQVDEAMSAISAGSHAGDADLDLAASLLEPVGSVIRVPENQLDAVTALSGSGPAYVFLLAEALVDAGVLVGLPRQLATKLVVQTLLGSAVMLRDAGSHPVELREMVSSPGGTTIAAVRELESSGVRAAVFDAVEAALARAGELAGDR